MTRTTSSTTRCRYVLSAGDGWTRREFLRGAAGVAALKKLPLAMGASRFAYVGCGDDLLRVFRVQGELWTQIQRVPSRAPACVLLSPAQQTLYVANEIDEHEGLLRGTVEAFHIHPGDGRLTLLSRTALSLSAPRPRHVAVSPDGKLLAVAAYGGGIYNLIAIAQEGSLGQVSSIFKDAGCGPHALLQGAAHPHTLLFDAEGRHLLSSDFGSDRLNVFALDDGVLRQSMQRSTGEGSGPSDCMVLRARWFATASRVASWVRRSSGCRCLRVVWRCILQAECCTPRKAHGESTPEVAGCRPWGHGCQARARSLSHLMG
jgi:hypothetical protein